MDLQLKGKRTLVTGASKGIGFSIAESLAGEGCDVVMVARDADVLQKSAGQVETAEISILDTKMLLCKYVEKAKNQHLTDYNMSISNICPLSKEQQCLE